MSALLNKNRVTALAFIGFGAVFLHAALTFTPGFVDESIVMGPMTYPKWLFIGWISVSVIYLFTGKNDLRFVDLSKSSPALLTALVTIGGYFFLFPTLGLPLSTFLFLVAFFFFEGMRAIKVVVPTAFLIALLFWYVFEKMLKISMPRGVLDLLG